MPVTINFTLSEIFILLVFVAMLGALFGVCIQYVWTEYYRQISYDYKRELGMYELRKALGKGGEY